MGPGPQNHRFDLQAAAAAGLGLGGGDRPAQGPPVGPQGPQDLGRQRAWLTLKLQQQGLQLTQAHFWY
jgi:hypothetical protein